MVMDRISATLRVHVAQRLQPRRYVCDIFDFEEWLICSALLFGWGVVCGWCGGVGFRPIPRSGPCGGTPRPIRWPTFARTTGQEDTPA